MAAPQRSSQWPTATPRPCSGWTPTPHPAAPFLIIHGGREDTYLADQSQRMAAALAAAEVEVIYAAVPDVGHDGSNDWARSGPLILAFLETRLHPAA